METVPFSYAHAYAYVTPGFTRLILCLCLCLCLWLCRKCKPGLIDHSQQTKHNNARLSRTKCRRMCTGAVTQWFGRAAKDSEKLKNGEDIGILGQWSRTSRTLKH